MGSLAESRKFFLEVIDDIAKQQTMPARFFDKTAEQLGATGV